MRAQVAGEPGGNGLFEKQPNVSPVPGAGPFDRRGNRQALAGLEEGLRILPPGIVVEVDGEEEACLVQKHRVDAHDKWVSLAIFPREMPADDFIGDGQEMLVRTFRAFDAGLLADPPHPLVTAGGLVAGASGFAAFEPAGIDICPPAEQ